MIIFQINLIHFAGNGDLEICIGVSGCVAPNMHTSNGDSHGHKVAGTMVQEFDRTAFFIFVFIFDQSFLIPDLLVLEDYSMTSSEQEAMLRAFH